MVRIYDKKATETTEHKVILNSTGYPAFWDFEFSYFKKPIKNLIPYSQISLPQVAEVVRSNRFKKPCEELRRIKGESEQRAYKALNFDYVCFSGTFFKRDSTSLISHSNLICIDLDKVDVQTVKAKLINDPETVMMFTSPSGNGLKWIVSINLRKYEHLKWFNGISRYLSDKYGLEADKACKDIARACFIGHDPELYFNPVFA